MVKSLVFIAIWIILLVGSYKFIKLNITHHEKSEQ